MWRSRTVTVTLLSALTLTTCCVSLSGYGRRRPPPDYTWYDVNGNRVAEKWKTTADGARVLDAQGRPVPEPGVPYDRYHRPWVFVNGAWAPQPPPAGSYSSGSSYRSSSWLWGGSGYRSTDSGSSYRSTGGGGSSGGGTSAPAGSSISRGGFGSTGMSGGSSGG